MQVGKVAGLTGCILLHAHALFAQTTLTPLASAPYSDSASYLIEERCSAVFLFLASTADQTDQTAVQQYGAVAAQFRARAEKLLPPSADRDHSKAQLTEFLVAYDEDFTAAWTSESADVDSVLVLDLAFCADLLLRAEDPQQVSDAYGALA